MPPTSASYVLPTHMLRPSVQVRQCISALHRLSDRASIGHKARERRVRAATNIHACRFGLVVRIRVPQRRKRGSPQG